MRIPHWIKNSFVIAPLLFSGRFTNLNDWLFCLAGFICFCLLSSAVYLINDVCDRNKDALHPQKSSRPVAAGRLSVGTALAGAIFLLLIAGAITFGIVRQRYNPDLPLHGSGFAVWAGAYVVSHLLYSVWLKSHPIVDVIVVAFGFVLRAMAGAAAIAVPVSPWLVVCTFTLCLFIAFAKRRSEVTELPAETAGDIRRPLRAYTPSNLEHMLTVSAALAILTYTLYCLAPRTIRHVGSAHMVWTIPLVVYGMFRYNLLTRLAGMGDPISVVLKDKVLWLVIICFVILSALVLKFGSLESVRDILDVEVFIK